MSVVSMSRDDPVHTYTVLMHMYLSLHVYQKMIGRGPVCDWCGQTHLFVDRLEYSKKIVQNTRKFFIICYLSMRNTSEREISDILGGSFAYSEHTQNKCSHSLAINGAWCHMLFRCPCIGHRPEHTHTHTHTKTHMLMAIDTHAHTHTLQFSFWRVCCQQKVTPSAMNRTDSLASHTDSSRNFNQIGKFGR